MRIDPNYHDPVARCLFLLTRTISVKRSDNVETNCLEWQGCTNQKDHKGYGWARVCGKGWLVHRAVYNFLVEPIPEGMDVLHKCDNTLCINFEHLLKGTQHDNNADMVKKGRWKGLIGKHKPKLDKEQMETLIYMVKKGVMSYAEIGRWFEVSIQSVSRFALLAGIRRVKRISK